MSLDNFTQEAVIRLADGIISRIEEKISLARKKDELRRELARILSPIQNEPFFDEISKLVLSGNLADQFVSFCTDKSLTDQSLPARAESIADACQVSIAYRSSVKSTIDQIAYAFFHIVNRPQTEDAKALHNMSLGENDENKEHPSNINGKLDQLLARPAASTPPPHPMENKAEEMLPVHNLRMQNSYFTGREKELRDIHSALENTALIARAQVITGMSGSGKTQLALEYAYRFKSEYDCLWWVPAETETQVRNAYQEFAERMQLPLPAPQDGNSVIRAVLQWMDRHSRWLFIYDHLETLAPECPWWPRDPKGDILITTQNRHILIGGLHAIRDFSPDDAMAFLRRRTGGKFDPPLAAMLSQRLGYFPLALEQAAVYINHGSSNAAYLSLLTTYGLERLEETEGVYDYPQSFAATWSISCRKITNEAARQLLYLCAYIAPENIEAALFEENAELLPTPLSESMRTVVQRNRVWSELTKYSLLREEDGWNSFSMHRLLQEVIRNQLKAEPQWVHCCLAIFENIYEYDNGNVASRDQFIRLTPHVEALVSHAISGFSDDATQKGIAQLCAEAGYGQYLLGHYDQALEWDQKTCAISEKVFGKEHLDTASAYHNLAGVYASQGDYPKALEGYQKALAIKDKVLGPTHPGTAVTRQNMAGVYASQGDYAKALEGYQKALAIREKALGTEHPDTAIIYNNIAGVFENQGDDAKALEWYQKALVIYKKVFGKEHPNTATTYHNIAGLYLNHGDYSKALELYLKALAIFERILGKAHPNTASTCNSIATVYIAQGEDAKALEWYRKALAIDERVLGTEHPDTATTYHNIAGVYKSQGDYPKALEGFHKTLAIREKVLGTEHPSTAIAYTSIAGVYESLGDTPKALALYQKALAIFEARLGTEHPYTKSTRERVQSLQA